jgi:hypothetical protein
MTAGRASPRFLPAALAILLAGAAFAPLPAAEDAAHVAVHIAGIEVVGPDQVMLLLADETEERALPIAIGRDQGLAIYLGKEKTATPRPMTHDLLAGMLKTLGAVVERITVTALRQDTYYAEISVRAAGRTHTVDARPSDAIALAVRTDAPMFSAPALLRPLGSFGRPPATAAADRRLGLSVQELDADLAEYLGAGQVRGVLVASVREGGEAERAGLRRGDIVRELNGRAVPDLAAWRAALDSAPAPRFTVWRDGRTLTHPRPGLTRPPRTRRRRPGPPRGAPPRPAPRGRGPPGRPA